MAGLKESDWNKFLKANPSVDDPGLADALGEYAKTVGKDVDDQLEALEEVVELAEKAKKSNNKNKEVTSYLDDVLSEARKEKKKLDDDDDDDSLPPLGEKCDEFLDQAKKGKPRSFLLVCKGSRVKYLAVKKKPVKKSELAEAKKLGFKGQAYFGVITGQGMNLVFNLSMEDGYTAPPCKEKSLKNFLGQHANFECKPTFAIVATAPTIPFDEDDLSNPLIARFVAMEEKISNVLVARPEVAAELTKTVSEIRLLLQDGDFTGAEPGVSALATRLQELLGGGQAATQTATPASPTQTPAATSQPSQSVDNDALKTKLQEAFNKLVPQLKQAVATYPDKKVELLTPVAQIKKQMEAGELQEAKAGILAVGQLLKSVMAQGTSTATPAQPEVDPRAEYERKLAALQPSYAQALTDMLGDTGKFRAVMAYATEQAEAGGYGNAIKAIDRLATAVEQAIAAAASSPQGATTAAGSTDGLFVAMQKSRLVWDQTRKKVASELQALEATIVEQCEQINDDPAEEFEVDLDELASGVKELQSIMEKLDTRLLDKLDEALNSTDKEMRSQNHREAVAIIKEYQDIVDSDPLIAGVDNSGFMTTSIKTTFSSVLTDLASQL